MKTVLITGGTGLVGTALTKALLQQGYHVIILTRDPKKSTARGAFGNQVTYAAWDVKAQTIDVAAVLQADCIVHLAGAGVVDHRWTESYKKEIIDSRVESSKLLIATLTGNPHKVLTFVSASATGWYGPDTAASLKNGFTEDATSDNSFLGEACRLWEESSVQVEKMGIRRVVFRTGIVLAKEGGALAEFKKPLKFGIAGILGNGEQIVCWIAIQDLCEMYCYALENESLHGVYNAVAPHPVSNKELTLALAKAMKGTRYISMHVPAFVLKIMLGQSSVEVLKSTNVSSRKIEMAGYHFKLPAIEEAIKALV
ncbi:MAG: TIGR01777 family oxidoreductase [Chitinophagaceae bacterium]